MNNLKMALLCWVSIGYNRRMAKISEISYVHVIERSGAIGRTRTRRQTSQQAAMKASYASAVQLPLCLILVRLQLTVRSVIFSEAEQIINFILNFPKWL